MFELIVALGAGLLSFLSPCVLPLIPGYISYISGSSLNDLIKEKNTNLTPIIFFTLGFSIVFIIFGAASTYFWIDPYSKITGTIMTQHLGHGYPIGEDLKDFFYKYIAKNIE